MNVGERGGSHVYRGVCFRPIKTRKLLNLNKSISKFFTKSLLHKMVPPACFASILTFSCIISSVNPLKTIHPRQVLPRWDNSVIADDEAFDGAVCKANRFLAAMKGTDEAAGKIFASTTNPPTVKSPWKGDLKCKRFVVVGNRLANQKQWRCDSGDGIYPMIQTKNFSATLMASRNTRICSTI